MKNILYTLIIGIAIILSIVTIRDCNRNHSSCSYDQYEWLKQNADSDSSIYNQLLHYKSALNFTDSI